MDRIDTIAGRIERGEGTLGKLTMKDDPLLCQHQQPESRTARLDRRVQEESQEVHDDSVEDFLDGMVHSDYGD